MPNDRPTDPDPLTLRIKGCLDCPRLERKEARHFLLGNETGETRYCNKARRYVYPHEGCEPPPKWCPLRGANR